MSKSTVGLEVRQALWSRRNFLKAGAGLIAGASTLGALSAFAADTPHKIVVVGGGYGGATVSKYLKMWGKDAVEITMIEPNAEFMSPIMSGMVISGNLELDRITFNYDRLTGVHGVNWVQDRVTAVDSEAKTVTLSDASVVSYDRLILSPGIDFVDVEGWDKEKLPHAWGGSDQALLLKEQIASFPENGTLVVTVPTYPFRCPPGPYERATTFADHLIAEGKNPQVVLLDTQPDVLIRLPHEQEMFHALFDEFNIDFRVNARVKSVESGDENGAGRTLTYATLIRDPETGAEIGEEEETTTIEADVINLIADQKATPLLYEAGLVPDGELWAPINPLTFESTVEGKSNIHILGDSQGSALSKAGQMANSQAKVCADAILRTLAEQEVYQTPVYTAGGYANVTLTKVNWIGVSYRYDAVANPEEPLQRTAFKVAPEPSSENFEPMLQWANNLFADTWG